MINHCQPKHIFSSGKFGTFVSIQPFLDPSTIVRNISINTIFSFLNKKNCFSLMFVKRKKKKIVFFHI